VLVGIVITQFLVRPISRATFALNSAEGTFRFVHARVKEFAEAICLYSGQADERQRADLAFDRLYSKFFRLFRWQWVLNMSTGFQGSAAVLMCFVILSIVISSKGGTLEGAPPNTDTVNASVSTIQVMTMSLFAIPQLYGLPVP